MGFTEGDAFERREEDGGGASQDRVHETVEEDFGSAKETPEIEVEAAGEGFG